ncbi:zinc ABC transporter substrate-binding protein [Oceanomicrobium pacificus]|uniref:High-affinity zinc uptake system protein ZnuA n=1 Tax=Oceanomicrobium pacificus TaxID=2692916 RepID=A0A6B0TRZ8_9RHOB|nr:zinc ABC transporter substrate-binding protein [Oceanomicrobium pacificus]MXU64124.1 zinc ABC transporter solute-binding protein [Oceanomicrobium pacificus]
MSRFRRSLSTAAILAVIAPVAGAAAPKVVTDIRPVHALVARVMEGAGTPDLLLQGSEDPHHQSLKPSQARNLQDADMLVWIGPAMTPWLAEAAEALGDGQSLALLDLDVTAQRETRDGPIFDHDHDHEDGDHDDHGHDDHDDEKHGDEDHDDHGDEAHDDHADDEDHAEHDDHDDHDDHDSEEHAEGHDEHDDHADEDGHDDHDDHAGHDHGPIDPHAWLDPANAAAWTGVLAEKLAELDPENADLYRANAEAAQAELAALAEELNAQLSDLDAPFVVYHDATQYFEEAFDLHALGSIAVSDNAKPGAARLRDIRTEMQEGDLHCVLSDTSASESVLRTATEGMDVEVVTLDLLGVDLEPGAALYGQMLRAMADDIAGCLSHD